MKYPFYVLACVALSLAGCAKDNIAVQPNASALNADLAYLSINVSTENEDAQNGECAGTERCILTVEDALVVVYEKDGDRRPPEASIVAQGRTDFTGNVEFPELLPTTYMIDVVCAAGETTVSVTPRTGQYTTVLIRL